MVYHSFEYSSCNVLAMYDSKNKMFNIVILKNQLAMVINHVALLFYITFTKCWKL